jgi:peptidoglycan/xylan/chitin deacetylase (PgdA/CDA1 family)
VTNIWVKRSALPWLAEKGIVLTFDDGPNLAGRTTERLLDVLAAAGIRAVFCVSGYAAERAPELVQRMFADGHLLVNHSYSHRAELLFREEEMLADVGRAEATLSQILGPDNYRGNWFRPPGGWISPPVLRCVETFGFQILPITHFGFDTWCTRFGARRLMKAHLRVADRDRAGVFVLHDGLVRFRPLDRLCDLLPGNDRSWVPDAVDALITGLRARGFSFGLPPFE